MQVKVVWEWVEGHAVECKGWHNSTTPECFKDQADKLAKAALLHAIAGGSAYEGDFPFEMVTINLTGKRVGGSPCQASQEHWGNNAAKLLFVEKDIIEQENFHLVWWDSVGAAMASYPKMYCVWLTKQVLDFCGSNVQQYYWSNGICSPKCDFYGDHNEFTTHIS
jgi:hypothetical protein